MTKLAIFASGSGSNFQAIVDAITNRHILATCEVLITDNDEAKVINRAKKAGIPVHTFDPKKYDKKATFEREILKVLQSYGVTFIVLAGYMRLVGPTILKPFDQKIVNIHPSLLPSFPGLNAIEQALHAGVKVTGVTIHYVDQGMDTGPIIAQEAVAISKEDTVHTLTEKIHAVEHSLYCETLAKLLNKEASTHT